MADQYRATLESGEFEAAPIARAGGPDDERERIESACRDYGQFVNPHLADLLERLALDKCFVAAEGHVLIDAEGGRYLDAVSGYGAVPFGHNPDWVWQAVQDFAQRHEPCMVQPSILPGAGELAEALVRHAPPGMRYVTFGSSGTEAVEAAIKACRIATGKLGILSTENGFHGKTLGALSATGRPFFQEGCGAPAAGFRFVPYGDADALEAALVERGHETAAFIVEPIQGEGGVIEPPAGYLGLVQRICDRHGVLLIVDEIQTGLGRTGTLFACQSEGVTPDALTVAKALGGGLVAVSACLLSARAWTREFAAKHSSTFGGNALAMRVGLRVVERLASEEHGLLENVVRQGSYLKRGLRALQREHGSAIREVRGRGLMLGVELGVDPSFMERGVGTFMVRLGNHLPAFAASYLLNVCGLRVAPVLNGGNVLRVQPPLTVTRDECDWIIRAFQQLARVIGSGRSDELAAHLLASKASNRSPATATRDHPPTPADRAAETEGHFAFIVHMLDVRSMVEFDRSLGGLSSPELEELARRFEDSAEPFHASSVRIQSASGHVAKGDFIILPKTTTHLLRMSPEQALDDVGAAVRLGKERGARIVGLGGYTSVVAQNLRALVKIGVPLTSGNSYTVVSAVDAAVEASRMTGRPMERDQAAIVGGAGSIGSALATLIAERVASLVLVGREGDAGALQNRYAVVLARMIRHLARRRDQGVRFAARSLADELSRLECGEELSQTEGRLRLTESATQRVLAQTRDLPIRVTVDLPAAVVQSDIVFLATSSPEPLLRPEMVRPGTVVCDLSRPANVSDELFQREDVIVIDGGIVAVPGRPNLGFRFGLAPGLAYACMAETMMLALEQRYEHTSLGRDLQEDTLASFRDLASKHGFRLAELRARQRPIDLRDWRGRTAA